jgi:putative NADH-flavin reductase
VKLTIFGATGKTGSVVTERAIARGHDVTVFVRDPSRLASASERLHVAVGEVTKDDDAVADAIVGGDAVLVTLGPRSPLARDVMTPSLQRIVAAMTQHGVERIVLLSALGLGDAVESAPILMTAIGRSLLRAPAADKRASERLLSNSDLDWAALYPGALTGGSGKGT